MIPPLRERPSDIPMLARYFIDKFCRDLNKKPLVAVAGGRRASSAPYPWPGNVRELQNCIERAAILTEGDTIHPRHLNLSFRGPTQRRQPVDEDGGPVVEDRSVGHAGRGVAADAAGGRAAQDRAGAEEAGRQSRPRGRDSAGQLQDVHRETEGIQSRRASVGRPFDGLRAVPELVSGYNQTPCGPLPSLYVPVLFFLGSAFTPGLQACAFEREIALARVARERRPRARTPRAPRRSGRACASRSPRTLGRGGSRSSDGSRVQRVDELEARARDRTPSRPRPRGSSSTTGDGASCGERRRRAPRCAPSRSPPACALARGRRRSRPAARTGRARRRASRRARARRGRGG